MLMYQDLHTVEKIPRLYIRRFAISCEPALIESKIGDKSADVLPCVVLRRLQGEKKNRGQKLYSRTAPMRMASLTDVRTF